MFQLNVCKFVKYQLKLMLRFSKEQFIRSAVRVDACKKKSFLLLVTEIAIS